MDAYFEDEPGYRVRPDQFALPEISPGAPTRPRSWAWPPRSGSTRGWRRRPPTRSASSGRRGGRRPAASTSPSRGSRADEPAFDVFWEAAVRRRAVDLRLPAPRRTTTPLTRHLQPWGVVRSPAAGTPWGSTPTAARSGCSGSPGWSAGRRRGSPGAYDVPPGTDVREVARRLAPDAAAEQRSCWCARGRAAAAPRRRARRARTSPARTSRRRWDRVARPRGAAVPTSCSPSAPTSYVEGPAALRDEVVARLRAAAGVPA